MDTIKNEILDPFQVNICRVCLRKVLKATFLFSAESKDIIVEKLHSCFQISLTYNKYLPSVICDDCIEELNIAYNFRQKCLTIEERYSSLLKITDEKLESQNNVLIEHKEEILDRAENLEDDIDHLSGDLRSNVGRGALYFLKSV